MVAFERHHREKIEIFSTWWCRFFCFLHTIDSVSSVAQGGGGMCVLIFQYVTPQENSWHPLISHHVRWRASQKRCFVHVSAAHGEGSCSTHDLSTCHRCYSLRLNVTLAIFSHLDPLPMCHNTLEKFIRASCFLYIFLRPLFWSCSLAFNRIELHGLTTCQSVVKKWTLTSKWCH